MLSHLPQVLVLAIIGWISGGLVNYLADVLPRRRKFVAPFCLACEAEQPLVHYFIWPRRCMACGKPRSMRVWGIEAVMTAVAVWLWFRSPEILSFVFGFALLVYFALVAVIDLEHRLILHPVSLAGVALGLSVGTWSNGWQKTLLGGIAGFGFMFGLYALGFLFSGLISKLRGRQINEEALGFGDVNLSGVLGLILGWPGIVFGLVLAILASGLVSLFYLLVMLATRRYRAFTAIPYGPFLIAGGIILLFFRELVLP